MMAKLPGDVRLQIVRVTTKDVWEIEELLQVLRIEVEAREVSEGVGAHEAHSSTTSSHQQRSVQATASTMVTRDAGNGNIVCVYCKEGHYSASCIRISTIPARREILRKEGCCFVCLRKGHRANECQSYRKCCRCGRKHHQSICEQGSAVQPIENHDTKETPTTTSTVAKTRNNVLLQTARSKAYTADNQLVAVHILLDSGSQRSYITNSKLKLAPLRQERLALNTFGNTKCKRENCDLIAVTLQGRMGENIEIQVLSFPAICSALQTAVVVDQYPHLRDLELVDTDGDENCSDSIDILIGSDV